MHSIAALLFAVVQRVSMPIVNQDIRMARCPDMCDTPFFSGLFVQRCTGHLRVRIYVWATVAMVHAHGLWDTMAQLWGCLYVFQTVQHIRT
jgi:hypothetical protein